MHEVFDEDDFKPGPHRRDTEVTLGPLLLLSLFFGLVLLCGLCFGLGYSIGIHGARNAAAVVQQSGAGASSPSTGSFAKPSATSQGSSQSRGAAGGQSAADGAAAGAQNAGVMPASRGEAAQPAVRPALGAAATSGQPAPAVQNTSTNALMVQVAVVSHQEDANVLVGALQRRGYAVTVHRDAADEQFHVRIGPFSNRNDAYATRQKLLGDGYNAVVQQ